MPTGLSPQVWAHHGDPTGVHSLGRARSGALRSRIRQGNVTSAQYIISSKPTGRIAMDAAEINDLEVLQNLKMVNGNS